MCGRYANSGRKMPAQEGLSRTRSGKSGKPMGASPAVQAACARGLTHRRAAWLCTTARSGIRVETKKPTRDARLAKHAAWRWDFVADATSTGHPLRCLRVKDEATRWSLASEVDSSLSHQRGIAGLKQLVVLNGATRYFRSENEPELRAQPVLTFFKRQGRTASRLAPGKPWPNGSNERFDGNFRLECLEAECVPSLVKARVMIEAWRRHYNQDRPHRAIGYRTSAIAYGGR